MSWLFRFSLSQWRQHLLQLLLLILGVALGTAVIIAIDLANESARRGFEQSTQTLMGRATHRIVGSAHGVPQTVYRDLRTQWGLEQSAPVVTGFVRLQEDPSQPYRLLGIDPFAEAPFRPYLNASMNRSAQTPSHNRAPALAQWKGLITQAGKLILPAHLAQDLGHPHILHLQHGSLRTQGQVIAQIRSPDRFTRLSLAHVILTDVQTAQEILGLGPQLSHIDLILPSATEAQTLKELQQWLPAGLRIEPAAARANSLQQMSRAFRLNLSALSLLALLVGLFLIYNTVSFAVVRRRQEMGILRALGVTRREIFLQIVLENLLLALIGVILGTGLGYLLGQGALRLVLRTINDLYFTLQVSQVGLYPSSLAKGLLGGLLAALLATLLPAWEATHTPPAGVLRASGLESRLQRWLWPLATLGLMLALSAGLLLKLPSDSLPFAFFCFMLVVAGAALAVPLLTQGLMHLAAAGLRHEYRLAPRNVARSLSRTAVAIAALMIAVSVVVAVNIMIGSFRGTVVDWLERTLSADIFITLAPENQTQEDQNSTGLPLSLPAEIRQMEGIQRVESNRHLGVDSPRYGHFTLLALSHDIAAKRRYLWRDPQLKNGLWKALEQGGVLVSEPFARRQHLGLHGGQFVRLETDRGPQRFPILGIYYDYSPEQGTVLFSEAVFRHYWRDHELSALAVFVQPGHPPEQVMTTLRQHLGPRFPLLIQSNQHLRASALEIFDRTFAITSALRLLAILVAFMGVLSTLLALLVERSREFGLLRALGLSRRQIAGQILLESGLMGLSASLLALPLGALLSLFLIKVINLRSFGWSMDFMARPEYFMQGLWLAVGAALLAGLYPAWKVNRLTPAQVLRYE